MTRGGILPGLLLPNRWECLFTFGAKLCIKLHLQDEIYFNTALAQHVLSTGQSPDFSKVIILVKEWTEKYYWRRAWVSNKT